MYLRTVDMIYELSGMAAPTMEEVRFEARELVQRSGWGVPLILALRKIHNPYRREAIARSLMDRWNEMLRDRDEQTFYYDGDGNGCFCWIDAESDFMRVIRHSTAEQVDWEQHHTHQTPQTRPMQTPTIRPMQATQNNQYNAPVYYGCTFTTNNHTTNNYYSLAPQGEEARQQTTTYPRENDYAALVLWLEQQKANGTDYYAAAQFNRSKMCRQLSDILGWTVSENSLRKAQNKN